MGTSGICGSPGWVTARGDPARLFSWQLAGRTRFRRLDQLLLGLAEEIQVLERADDPMLYVERKEYPTMKRKLRAGMENALVVLPAAPSFDAIRRARKLYPGDRPVTV